MEGDCAAYSPDPDWLRPGLRGFWLRDSYRKIGCFRWQESFFPRSCGRCARIFWEKKILANENIRFLRYESRSQNPHIGFSTVLLFTPHPDSQQPQFGGSCERGVGCSWGGAASDGDRVYRSQRPESGSGVSRLGKYPAVFPRVKWLYSAQCRSISYLLLT